MVNEPSATPGLDPHAAFDALIRRYVRPGTVALDAGAGRGERYRYDYADLAAAVVGADVDPAVATNANLTEAVRADLAALPFADATFDLVFAKYVFEHLEHPGRTLRELRRVMRPGGHLVFHTPNRYHYVALAARATPHRFHEWFNEQRGCDEADTFPTRYRANDRRSLRRALPAAGFRIRNLEMIEPPADYLFFHPWAHAAGEAYGRFLRRRPSLADLRCVIVGDAEAVGGPGTEVFARPSERT
ncbi:MAG: class I SAM-dependent methyltransferase [Actinomycetota bacterium]